MFLRWPFTTTTMKSPGATTKNDRATGLNSRGQSQANAGRWRKLLLQEQRRRLGQQSE
uniref:Uncharacterized protein n=1 Tax=Plectus sambesii TaxID=2011161 RepID=A0A914VTM4_9BILA